MKLYIANTPTEAHIICELLKSENIACEVKGADMFGLQGEIPMDDNSSPYIQLNDVHLEQQALTLITQYQSDNLEKINVTIKGSHCPHCNEEVDSSLLLCWNCSQPYRLVD
ncbi:DUF2007 domain-containing protein [Vibrio sp.]|nr:DUF2007 domain-containing protein [Vibrio sp.]